MKGKLLLRSACSHADATALRALEQEAFQHTWSTETFLKEFQKKDRLYVVGEVPSSLIVCSAALNWVADECHLNSMVVAPDFRGQGLSSETLGGLLVFAISLGLNWMTLEVKWHNPPALGLYRKFGFVTLGRRKGYYSDGQDARIMWAGPLRSPVFAERCTSYRELGANLRETWKRQVGGEPTTGCGDMVSK